MQKEFDLTGQSVFVLLPKPVQEESVNKHLSAAVMLTRDANPALRSAEDFEGLFAYCSVLSYTELYGALQGCVPCLNLSGHHLQQMERTLLDYFGRIDMPTVFPQAWTVIADHFENVAKSLPGLVRLASCTHGSCSHWAG